MPFYAMKIIDRGWSSKFKVSTATESV